MFNALLLSLDAGQSYKNVKVLQPDDFARFNYPSPFEEWTIGFLHEDNIFLAHIWNICVIHLDKQERSGPGSYHADRIVLSNDVIYQNCTVLPVEVWTAAGVPSITTTSLGITGQLVFSCQHGTFLTHDATVSTIIMKNNFRQPPIVSTQYVSMSTKQIEKDANRPQSIHSKIIHE